MSKDPAYYRNVYLRYPGELTDADICFPPEDRLPDWLLRILWAAEYRQAAGQTHQFHCPECGRVLFESCIEWLGATKRDWIDVAAEIDCNRCAPAPATHCAAEHIYLEPRARHERRQREYEAYLANMPDPADFPDPAQPPANRQELFRLLEAPAYWRRDQPRFAGHCPSCRQLHFLSNIPWVIETEPSDRLQPVVEIDCAELHGHEPPCPARLYLEPKARYEKRLDTQGVRDPADFRATRAEWAANRAGLLLAEAYRQGQSRPRAVHCPACHRVLFRSYIDWRVIPYAEAPLIAIGQEIETLVFCDNPRCNPGVFAVEPRARYEKRQAARAQPRLRPEPEPARLPTEDESAADE